MSTSVATKTGNLFVTLAPTAETAEFLAHRAQLQARLGGVPVSPVHYTCQRFMFGQAEMLEGFLSALAAGLAGFRPIQIYGTAIVPLFSEFRKARVLKWRVEISPALEAFAAMVEKTLLVSGGHSLYPPNWRSHLVTGLEQITGLDLNRDLDRVPIPIPLFTGEVVLLTQHTSQGKFETLKCIPLETND